MPEGMPEFQRGPRYRDATGRFSRRMSFENTTYALDGTTGGLAPPGCERDISYAPRDDDTCSPCTLAGTDYSSGI